tara:strand:+ start:426 stop:1025 length:600 start_codon:yes stop_codon:yes gene_type:complete
MIRLLLVLILVNFFLSCSKGLFDGDIQKNLEEMDKIHGVCNNPYRTYNKAQKRICEDKERAAGPDGKVGEPLNITKLIEDFRGGGTKNVYQGMSINPVLWEASLIMLDEYPLNIVDSQGGFISTDWITEKGNPNQRCLIKVSITSQELVSNGVKVKLLCEQRELEVWYQENIPYTEEEKNLILKILDIANQISVIDKLS